MKKAFEYRQHAEECRALARGMPDGDARDQLLKMAETWEGLAEDRDRKLTAADEEKPTEPAIE